MREEYIVNLRGKRYILFAGLLAMAHEQGLKEVREEIVQIPSEENGNLAVTKATVLTEDGRSFSGIGDASPASVGKNIAVHVLRMSSTRAKARAFRDLCNVGEAALEELSDGDEAPTPTQSQRTPERPRESRQEATQGLRSEAPDQRDNNGIPATRKQLNYLEALINEQGDDAMERFEGKVGKKLSELTKAEASEWVGKLSGRVS